MTASTSHVSRVAARIAYVVTRPWLQVTGVLVAIVVTLWSFDRVPARPGSPPCSASRRGSSASTSCARCAGTPCRPAGRPAAGTCASTRRASCSAWPHRPPRRRPLAHAPAAKGAGHGPALRGRRGGARPAGRRARADRVRSLSGATLPPQLLVAALGIALVVLVVALLLHRRRPGLLAARPHAPAPCRDQGLAAVDGLPADDHGTADRHRLVDGGAPHPVALLGVFGASQVAGIVPGVNGASAREGALVVGSPRSASRGRPPWALWR